MSFFRLLALSYLAWAAVFVVAVILVAHLPLPGNPATGSAAPVHTIGKDVTRQLPGQPQLRTVARLDLTLVTPFPASSAHDNVSPAKPHVVNQPERKLAKSERPAFPIPDPPPSSLSNLPVDLQPAASQHGKRALAEPAFRIPDPPPLDAPIFSHVRF